MTLPFPYIVYGVVKDGGTPVPSATVQIYDKTVPAGTAIATTDANGLYVYNIMDYVSSGSTVEVKCNHSQKEGKTTFTMKISGVAMSAQIAIAAAVKGGGFLYPLGTGYLEPKGDSGKIHFIKED